MVKIGIRELVFSETFLTRDEESVRLTAEIGGFTIPFELTFSALGSQENDPQIDQTVEANTVKLVFKNWKNVIGTTVAQPMLVAHNKGTPAFYTVAHRYAAPFNIVTFNVLFGGTMSEKVVPNEQ
jgi:hypothetical protein